MYDNRTKSLPLWQLSNTLLCFSWVKTPLNITRFPVLNTRYYKMQYFLQKKEDLQVFPKGKADSFHLCGGQASGKGKAENTGR